MTHLATLSFREARSEIHDCGTLRSSESSEEKIICPKPERVALTTFRSADFIKPFRQLRSMSPVAVDSSEAGCEIMEIFLRKHAHGETLKFARSPPHFSGSPPSRSMNPVVRDTQFLHRHHAYHHHHHQKHHHHPVAAAAQVKVVAGPPHHQHRPSPSVRIEGFDCSVRGFECTGRDTGRRVPALA